jgi:hypothetical protein
MMNFASLWIFLRLFRIHSHAKPRCMMGKIHVVTRFVKICNASLRFLHFFCIYN